MSGKVVSFINMKGGVGKTTLCIGIGEYLANSCDKNILFIDLDPQFNTTQSLMNEYDQEELYLNDYSPNNKTIKKLFETPANISAKPKMPEMNEIVIKLNEKIDIIPGTINLIFEDNNKNASTSKRVKKFISDNNLRDKYEFILIDCPPTISLYTDAALIASDFYVIPNRIDRYSILGITLLNQVVERLAYEESLTIKPLGIVYTMMEKIISQKTTQLIDTFESTDVVKKMGLFKTRTHYVKDLLVGLQGNISSHYKKSREDMSDLCKEFVGRLEGYEKL